MALKEVTKCAVCGAPIFANEGEEGDFSRFIFTCPHFGNKEYKLAVTRGDKTVVYYE